MKKAILGILVIILVFSSSCNKGNYVPETFSFKGVNYGANSVLGQTGVLIASSIDPTNPVNYTQVSCFFIHNSLPTVPGTYTVVKGIPAANQVALSMSFNSGQTTYTSTGGNGTQKIAVSISGGKVTLMGSNITLLYRNGNQADSAANFSLNITQQ